MGGHAGPSGDLAQPAAMRSYVLHVSRKDPTTRVPNRNLSMSFAATAFTKLVRVPKLVVAAV